MGLTQSLPMTSHTTIFLYIFSLLLSLVSADKPLVIFGRECPDVTGTSNFDQNSYLGKWYNVANSPFRWMKSEDLCPWAIYSKGTEYDIDVTNSEFHVDVQERDYVYGHALINKNLPGTLDVSFHSAPNPDGDNYIILNTDNEYFSYVWSCTDKSYGHNPVLWVLSKKGDLSRQAKEEMVKSALNILENDFGYEAEKLRSSMNYSIQEHCD